MARGLGYTLVPHLAVDGDTSFDELAKTVRFKAPVPAREVGLIFRRTQLKRPAIEALASAIKKCLPRSLQEAGKNTEIIDAT